MRTTLASVVFVLVFVSTSLAQDKKKVDDAWLHKVSTLKPDLQSKAIADKLRELNRFEKPDKVTFIIVVRGLSSQIRLENASGTTRSGDPYIRVFLPNGVLQPGQNIVQTLTFARPGGNNAPPVSYFLDLLSGQGNP